MIWVVPLQLQLALKLGVKDLLEDEVTLKEGLGSDPSVVEAGGTLPIGEVRCQCLVPGRVVVLMWLGSSWR